VGDVRVNLLKPLARQFPLPKGADDDPENWERDFIRHLSFFSDRVLLAAVDHILGNTNRQWNGFPRVDECVSACRSMEPRERQSSESRHRTTEELMAENAHLGRLNTIAAEGDIDRAARLCIILMKSSQTGCYDWSKVDSAVMYLDNKKLGLTDDDEAAA
jgi:hypothetical protein